MESNFHGSDMDLINFLYRSYSTLKNEYLLSRQEHVKEMDSLLKTVSRLQQHESDLIDTMKELRIYCDRLLEERATLLETIETLRNAEVTSPSTDNEDVLPQTEIKQEQPQDTRKPETGIDLMKQLTAEMAQMRSTINHSLCSQEEVKNLKALILEQSREIHSWRQSQKMQELDSPISNHEED